VTWIDRTLGSGEIVGERSLFGSDKIYEETPVGKLRAPCLYNCEMTSISRMLGQ
jgi:hypothetical protein